MDSRLRAFVAGHPSWSPDAVPADFAACPADAFALGPDDDLLAEIVPIRDEA